MRKYEVFFIVSANKSDDDVKAIAERYKAEAEQKGAIVTKAELWERRKLAYEIDGHTEGAYILILMDAEPTVPAHLNRLLRINDDVIRHRIFSVEE